MNKDSEQQALAVMEAHIVALNNHNPDALADTLHFPHYRLTGSSMKIWDNPANYFADFRARAGDGWHHSLFNDINIVHSVSNKVHLDVEVKRFDENNILLVNFRSLWVITCIESKWAAQFRSSFAGS